MAFIDQQPLVGILIMHIFQERTDAARVVSQRIEKFELEGGMWLIQNDVFLAELFDLLVAVLFE